jgi:hypothetical protein
MIEAVIGESMLVSIPLVLGAAILKITEPDRVTNLKTTRPSGMSPEGLASKTRVGNADYIYIPTGAQVTADVNGSRNSLKIKDDDLPNNNLQIYENETPVYQGNNTAESLQRISSRPNWSVLYMGPVDIMEAYVAFLAAIKRLKAVDKETSNHFRGRRY